jgi:hypothetical protein
MRHHADYLRQQADRCSHLAHQCFDLGVAERLRMMAAELKAKAVEVELENEGLLAHFVHLVKGRREPPAGLDRDWGASAR